MDAPTLPLRGKTALVTGGAKRIGREIALALAKAGADVGITFRESGGEAEQTVADLQRHGVKATALACNLEDAAAITEMVERALAYLGGLDLLVNNAGLFASVAMEDITASAWDTMYAVNVRAPFLVAQAALPALRAARGKIINIGSLGGLRPWETHAHYCTSKAALHMLSQTMAKAWAPEISVNCIAPGMIVQNEVGPQYQRFAERTPMRRNGTAMDVAESALFFATAEPFLTGQLLVVDGGLGL